MSSKRIAFWNEDTFIVISQNCSKEQARAILEALEEADLKMIEVDPVKLENKQEDTAKSPEATQISEASQVSDIKTPNTDAKEPLLKAEPAEVLENEESVHGIEVAAVSEMDELQQFLPGDMIEDDLEENIAQSTEFRFPTGRYQDMTLKDVLAQDKDKGFANIAYILKKQTDESLICLFRGALEGYFKERFMKYQNPYKDVASWNENCIEKFFMYFTEIFTVKDKENMAKQSNSQSFEELLNKASFDEKKSMIAAALTKYC